MENQINLRYAEIEAARLIEELEVMHLQEGRIFHERKDAFELSDIKFRKIFRFDKTTTDSIINLVEQYVQPSRTSALDASVQVLTTLRFLASGSYQNDIGQNSSMNICQSSVSRSIRNVTEILNQNEIFSTWVHFPRNLQEVKSIRNSFWEKYHFPGIIGCIDCTHVAIFPPPVQDLLFPEHIYVNRKGYHSINVQLICDVNMKIIHVNARYPGSTHDAYIWNNSNVLPVLKEIYNRGHTFFLLGDSGYALRPWLMTPMNDAVPNTPEDLYNQQHRSIRSTIERCNGLLKQRFRCLLKHRVLHYSPEASSRIINACTVLRNIAIENNIPEPEAEFDDEEVDLGMYDVDYHLNMPEDIENGNLNRANPDFVAGRRIRRELIYRFRH